ncbi:MAG: hypothetical protein QOI28_38 [Mycobacterium sp.]|nr:hypothetical protein [Mycobacterium sp.]
MSVDRPFLTAEVARAQVGADLDVIDTALDRIRQTSTDLVGNAFRIEVAERLERQVRTGQGLSYRMVGDIMDPPDGIEDPALPAGVKVRDQLARRLRITAAEVRRRAKLAVRIRARCSLTGTPLPPELPALAEAVEAGDVGEDHIREVCHAVDVLPNAVADQKDRVERTLVGHARQQDAAFVAVIGRRIADTLNPDGLFDDRDRMNRRSMTLGRQGPDGMSRLSGWITPEGRAYVEALKAAVRPGHHMPGAEQTVVDAGTDDRSGPQRLHDALLWGLRAGLESGTLGAHRGILVTVIATVTVDQMEQAARAMADPEVPMPGPARTGGGSSLPMRDLIRMGGNSVHYLAVFDGHSERPIYLGRSTRIATADQRIICHARDKGCTRPNCTVWGYDCEVHHTPDWNPHGATDADKLHFGCPSDHKLVTDGHATTTVTPDGRLAWTIGSDPPDINRIHHDDELLDDEPSPDDGC